jgi:hypothetical protein
VSLVELLIHPVTLILAPACCFPGFCSFLRTGTLLGAGPSHTRASPLLWCQESVRSAAGSHTISISGAVVAGWGSGMFRRVCAGVACVPNVALRVAAPAPVAVVVLRAPLAASRQRSSAAMMSSLSTRSRLLRGPVEMASVAVTRTLARRARTLFTNNAMGSAPRQHVAASVGWLSSAHKERGWASSTAAAAGAVFVTVAGAAGGCAACESDKNPERDGGELARAVARGDKVTVRRLLSQDADVNERHPAGWAPLHAAAVRGDGDMCETLLAAGANPDTEDA